MNFSKVNKIINIPSNLNNTFFKFWLQFIRPIHKMTNKEIDIISSFLYHRFELGKKIKDDDILDKVTMSDDIRKSVIEEYNMNPTYLNTVMANLKKKGVIINGKISKKLRPKLEEDADKFTIMITFDLKENEL